MIRRSRRLLRAASAAVALALLALPARAAGVSLPGEWYDTDKTNTGAPYGNDELVGMYWNYYLDQSPADGAFSYGEAWQETLAADLDGDYEVDPGEAWGSWRAGRDESCWAAAAGNCVLTVGGGDRYVGWVYEGAAADPAFTKTWEDAGASTQVLDAEYFPTVHQGAGGAPWTLTAPAWVEAQLLDGLPVALGAYWHDPAAGSPPTGSSHIINVYAIDRDARTVTLADNSRDFSQKDFTTYDYTYAAGVWTIPDYRPNGNEVAHVNDLTSFAVTEWVGDGAGGADSDWHTAANWSGGVVPQAADPLLFPRIEFTEAGYVSVVSAAEAQMLIVRGAETQIVVHPSGRITLGNLNLGGGTLRVDGLVSACRADVLGGTLLVDGGQFNALQDPGGLYGDVTVGGTITVQDGGAVQLGRHLTSVADAASISVSGSSTFAVAGDLRLDADLAVGGTGPLTIDGSLYPASGGRTLTVSAGTYVGADGGAIVEDGRRLTIQAEGTVVLGGDTKIEPVGRLVVEAGAAPVTVGYDAVIDGILEVAPGAGLDVANMLLLGRDAPAAGGARASVTDTSLAVGNQLRVGAGEGASLHARRSNVTVQSLFSVGHTADGAAEVAGGAVTCAYLHVGDGAKGDLTLDRDGSDAPLVGIGGAAPHVYVGIAGAGSVEHLAGTLTRADADGPYPDLILGYDYEGDGLYHLVDGTVHVNLCRVGRQGDGSVTQDGGLMKVETWLSLGLALGATGTYDLKGGTLEVDQVGDGPGSGTVNVDGGTLVLKGTSITTDRLNVGHAGAGSLALDAKTLNLDQFYVGEGAEGTFSQSYGTTTVGGLLCVGDASVGHVTQSCGDVTCSSLEVASEAGSSGDYAIDSGTLTVTGSLHVGAHGTGRFDSTGGATRIEADAVRVGFGDDAAGCVWRHDGGDLKVYGPLELGSWDADGTLELLGGAVTADEAVVGYRGTGAVAQSGGGAYVTGTLTLGLEGTGTGTYTLDDGRLETRMSVVGGAGSGEFTQNGGVHKVAFDLTIGDGGAGVYELAGGTLEVGRDVWCGTGGGSGTLVLSGGTLIASPNSLVISDGDDAVTGWGTVDTRVSNAGSLTASGGTLTLVKGCFGRGLFDIQPGATLRLGADARVDGPTTSGGTLQVGAGTTQLFGGLSGAPSSVLQVDAGASLELLCDGSAGVTRVEGTVLHAFSGTHAAGEVSIGAAGAPAVYELAHATLDVGDLHVGMAADGSDAPGILDITSRDAKLIVRNSLTIHPDGWVSTDYGVPVRMTGSAFDNRSRNPDACAALYELTFVFEGGPGTVDPFEVASPFGGEFVDFSTGFTCGFGMGTIALGGDDVGLLRLVDHRDNSPGAGPEVLAIYKLVINPGSRLDLNGLMLCMAGNVSPLVEDWIADGRLIDSSGRPLGAVHNPDLKVTILPEPATLALALAGLAGLCCRRRRRGPHA